VLLLIALAIGAFLANEAARRYGLTRNASAVKSTQRAPVVDVPAADSSTTPTTPIERARGVEETIQRQADEQAKRMP
jgi:hypothetical protein